MDSYFSNKKGHHRNRRAIFLGLGLGLIVALAFGFLAGMQPFGKVSAAPPQSDQVEPEAGTWRTWVLESGDQFRLPAPPDQQKTQAEIETLKALADGLDQT